MPTPTTLAILFLGLLVQPVPGLDQFNYRSTEGQDYGPEDWSEVQCENVANCVSSD